jgi:hypothetical protein
LVVEMRTRRHGLGAALEGMFGLVPRPFEERPPTRIQEPMKRIGLAYQHAKAAQVDGRWRDLARHADDIQEAAELLRQASREV